jgi:hypothetical protein
MMPAFPEWFLSVSINFIISESPPMMQ